MDFKTQGSSLKVLVIEDCEFQSWVLLAKLRRFSCQTTRAKNGREAVDLYLEGKKFDIILCDKEMPIMKGPEAIVKIRSMGSTMGSTEVKIVGMSADSNATEEFMSVGADMFVPKPMDFEVLEAIIKEVINKKNNGVV
ncbi:two-component response regulator ORR42 [Brachypodium distachyon]|uniref:Response regulatory domain-containing protein n=1 Tax=Brachypodium distachyon TaxID=15368 RepID=I1IWD4_BRADI|nr:two-component response regulator ORR42 [Brachypodium distachyon]XP_024311961.1 two-component response regulator ORR42 [Brachypodium distachyon]XP_024311962.1 two-component response regulator ORR42 [Brachypodium distachyon]XP_024311963.1 two-component response regulator ORR42 [Brachypodium distachyon]XP_024311964.1 two-component response regulator ORR42 [Brachypodium distachyon]KQJ81906.1 hypothetical protein BRADI_5g03730v3 [Brachypodium distachyon]PNT60725.1 hypothetical protein BRADI_5g0|eukprot:XP_010239714.1 two-component response regulator ORR42 [Brachypodium distachyon]